jgi:hypothetical protein
MSSVRQSSPTGRNFPRGKSKLNAAASGTRSCRSCELTSRRTWGPRAPSSRESRSSLHLATRPGTAVCRSRRTASKPSLPVTSCITPVKSLDRAGARCRITIRTFRVRVGSGYLRQWSEPRPYCLDHTSLLQRLVEFSRPMTEGSSSSRDVLASASAQSPDHRIAAALSTEQVKVPSDGRTLPREASSDRSTPRMRLHRS